MEKKQQTHQANRQRKMLMALPILILPFVTVLFWAMGGGKENAVSVAAPKEGFNIKLPDAKVNEDDPLNKLNYYDRAALDSLKFDELKKKDPNYSDDGLSVSYETDSMRIQEPQGRKSGLIMSSSRNPNEEKVYKKLEALQRAISAPPPVNGAVRVPMTQNSLSDSKIDVQELQQMMQSAGGPGEEDKEMEQINGMLQNILDIQHPQRVQDRLKKEAKEGKGEAYSIKTDTNTDIIGLLGNNPNTGIKNFGQESAHNGFYSFGGNEPTVIPENAIQAIVAETQTLVNGSTVKLRLGQDISIGGTAISKDTFIYGVAALKGERLTVEISGIRFRNSVFPVELTLYDMDGLEGIYIPGAINRDVAKASADRSMQTLGVTTLDDSWGSQAAGAGIEAVKSLFSKKVKLVKVIVKAGYRVLLRDTKSN